VKVEFIGVRGASGLSDVAIDNLQVRSDACPGGMKFQLVTHCAYAVCYFRYVYPFIYFIVAVPVHHIGLAYIIFYFEDF